MSTASCSPLLEARGIVKSFPGVRALDKVDVGLHDRHDGLVEGTWGLESPCHFVLEALHHDLCDPEKQVLFALEVVAHQRRGDRRIGRDASERRRRVAAPAEATHRVFEDEPLDGRVLLDRAWLGGFDFLK